MVRALRYLVCLWLAAFFVGCGSSPDTEPTPEKKAARIESFQATPASIRLGQSTILSWVVADALEVELRDEAGPILDNAPLQGSHTLTPDADATFRLVAKGADGVEVSRQVTVTVLPAGGPTVSLVADPQTISFGQTATLRWETSDAERVILRAGEEVLLDRHDTLQGELEVKPTSATIYEITAVGRGGDESKASAEVVVEPVIVSFSGPTERVLVGSTIGLSWKTEGALSLTLRTPEGFSMDVSADKIGSGSAVVTVEESGVFELVAKNGPAEKKATLQVPLLGKPHIVELSATPDRVTRGEQTLVTVSWKIEDATRASLFVGDRETPIDGSNLAEGTLEVEVDDATTLRLDATNTLGTSSKTFEIQAAEAPVFAIFEATPSRVAPAENFTLKWKVEHTETVSLFQGDEPLLSDSTEWEGERSLQIDGETTFRLEARNELGAVRSTELVVGVGAPLIDSFTTDKDRYGPGDDITFSWNVRGGARVQIVDWDGELVDGCSMSHVEIGSCTTKAPHGTGHQTFTLRVENGVGRVQEDVSVLVTDGPWIESFAATPTRLNEGETVRFSWEVSNDRAGTAPTLRLEDDTGTTVDLSGVDANKGFVDVTMDAPGTHHWVLTATTDGTSASSRDVEVTVVALPTVEATPSQPTFQLEWDRDFTLSWVTTGATSLQIFRLDGGAIVGSAVHTAAVGEVAEGSWKVVPGRTNFQWRVVATNELGASTFADIVIEILNPPAPITSFTASATTVTAGSEVTLSWETVGGTTLAPIFGAPRTLNGPEGAYIPVGQPTWLSLGDHCNVDDVDFDGCAVFNFPGGFSFPFDGVRHTSAQVFLNGVMGFNTAARLGETSDPQNLPSSSYGFIHLAPFWADLYNWDNGRVRYELKGTGTGRHLVIAWEGFSDEGDWDKYNFQVVLWETGAADYRYGRMLWQPMSSALDSDFVVGFQSPDRSVSHMFKAFGDSRTGTDLEFTSIRYFETSETPKGSRKVVVNKTTTFTLCVDASGEKVCQDLTVTVQ